MIEIEIISGMPTIEVNAATIVAGGDPLPGTVNVKDSGGDLIESKEVASGGEEDVEVADSLITVQYQNGTPIADYSVKATKPQLIEIPNPDMGATGNFYYVAGTDTITAAIDGPNTTYTTATLTNCHTPVYTLNNVVVSLPISLVSGDVLKVKITQSNNTLASKVKLEGSHA